MAGKAELQRRHYDDMESEHRLQMSLVRVLDCGSDGWVAANRWEEVLPKYREPFRGWIDTAATTQLDPDDERMRLEKAEGRWPFGMR